MFSGIAATSGVLVISRLIGTAASFLFTVILARTLAPANVGAVLTVISSAFLASVLVTLNIESGSIRFLVAAQEQDRSDISRGFVFFGRILLLAATPFVAGGFIVAFTIWGSDYSASQSMAIVLAAASIPLMGWLRLSSAHATAAGHPLRGSLPRTSLQPLLTLLVYLVAAHLVGWATTGSAAASFLIAFAATAIAQLWALRSARGFDAGRSRDLSDWRNWLANGLFLSPLILLQENLQYSVVIAASMGLSESDVAAFAIPLRFIAIIRFGVLAVNIAASPRISRAMARGDNTARDAELRRAAILKMGPAVGASVIVILFAAPILSLFGSDYVRGAAALAWFTLIPLSSALLGPNQMLLNIAGHKASVCAYSLAALVALFAALPMAGEKFGIEGAAAATACIYALWELALYVTTRVKVGADASVFSAFRRKP